jgi:hypothetical protein
MMKINNHLILLCIGCLLCMIANAQQAPSPDEKIPYACTFGREAEKNWGDDDFAQTFFFVVPEAYKKPVYIRIFDPEVGGSNDENHGPYNTKCRFSVYGGLRAHSHPDAKGQDPVGDYKSGFLLSTKTFSNEKTYDNEWYTLGPFNPVEGELQPEFGGRVFKVVIEGIAGDDGNLYKLFLSSDSDENKPVEGGNAFAYEYTFRLADAKGSVAHLYPFVGPKVTAVKIKVFDFDDEGIIRMVSVAKRGEIHKPALNGGWMENTHKISKEEVNTSLDVQFIKQKEVRNNNIVVVISNQYGELMPFYTTPIGGVPKFMYKIAYKAEDE